MTQRLRAHFIEPASSLSRLPYISPSSTNSERAGIGDWIIGRPRESERPPILQEW